MSAGRPLKFESPDALAEACKDYLDSFKGRTDAMPTLSGLAVHLDVDRKTLLNYQNRDEYFPVVKRIRTVIEAAVESYLLGSKGNVTGAIFWLKNNAGWTDKYEVEQEVRGTFKVSDEPDLAEFDRDFAVGASEGPAKRPH